MGYASLCNRTGITRSGHSTSRSCLQCGCMSTRLTCLRPTVLVRSRTASSSAPTQRLRAALRIPSLERTMRLRASSLNVLWARATRSSSERMKAVMSSGANFGTNAEYVTRLLISSLTASESLVRSAGCAIDAVRPFPSGEHRR